MKLKYQLGYTSSNNREITMWRQLDNCLNQQTIDTNIEPQKINDLLFVSAKIHACIMVHLV